MTRRLAALALVLAVLTALWPTVRRPPLRAFDQPFYLGIAYDLVHGRRFTDGYRFSAVQPDGLRASGMRFAPLVPALLAAEAELDPTLRRNMDCLVRGRGHDTTCGADAPFARFVQFAMLVATLWMVLPIALEAGLAPPAAVAALGLALLAAPTLLSNATYLMTEIPTLLCTTAGTWAFVAAVRHGRRRTAALAGLLFGLATLCRPAFLYLPALLALMLLTAPRARRAWQAALLLGAAALAVLPWIVRNTLVLGRPGLTFGYAGHTLAQRISFDRMTWRDYALSFPCWLPDGNGVGKLIAGAGACARFGWDERPDTFYAIGMRRLVPGFTHAAGGPDHLVRFLVAHEIWPHLAWHLATTLPLALRGLWIAHWWGFMLAIATAVALVRAVRQRDTPMLALLLPPFAMLALNAAVAVNQPRYNLQLIPAYAVAGGAALTRLLPRTSFASDPRSGPAPPPHRPDPSRSRSPDLPQVPPPEASFPFPRRDRAPRHRRRHEA